MRRFIVLLSYLLIAQFVLSASQCSSNQKEDMIKEIAAKKWVHSHEDDTEGMKAYRTDKYKFPPSRGREGFELKEDGAFTQYAIARTDGTEKVSGTWELIENQTIHVKLSNGQTFKLDFQSLSKEGVLFLNKEFL